MKPDDGKGPGEVLGKGVLIYKDAVPKTGTRLTKKEITQRFRKMSRAPKRRGTADS